MNSTYRIAIFAVLSFAAIFSPTFAEQPPITIGVMDPLAAPLACACVEGFAQRKYEKLAEYLEEKLARKVTVVFAESLDRVMQSAGGDGVGLVIGKNSVVKFDAAKHELAVRPLAMLTGPDGKVASTGRRKLKRKSSVVRFIRRKVKKKSLYLPNYIYGQ